VRSLPYRACARTLLPRAVPRLEGGLGDRLQSHPTHAPHRTAAAAGRAAVHRSPPALVAAGPGLLCGDAVAPALHGAAWAPHAARARAPEPGEIHRPPRGPHLLGPVGVRHLAPPAAAGVQPERGPEQPVPIGGGRLGRNGAVGRTAAAASGQGAAAGVQGEQEGRGGQGERRRAERRPAALLRGGGRCRGALAALLRGAGRLGHAVGLLLPPLSRHPDLRAGVLGHSQRRDRATWEQRALIISTRIPSIHMRAEDGRGGLARRGGRSGRQKLGTARRMNKLERRFGFWLYSPSGPPAALRRRRAPGARQHGVGGGALRGAATAALWRGSATRGAGGVQAAGAGAALLCARGLGLALARPAEARDAAQAQDSERRSSSGGGGDARPRPRRRRKDGRNCSARLPF
jgi:hypothetical protein